MTAEWGWDMASEREAWAHTASDGSTVTVTATKWPGPNRDRFMVDRTVDGTRVWLKHCPDMETASKVAGAVMDHPDWYHADTDRRHIERPDTPTGILTDVDRRTLLERWDRLYTDDPNPTPHAWWPLDDLRALIDGARTE